jgi:hypothetical protein
MNENPVVVETEDAGVESVTKPKPDDGFESATTVVAVSSFALADTNAKPDEVVGAVVVVGCVGKHFGTI